MQNKVSDLTSVYMHISCKNASSSTEKIKCIPRYADRHLVNILGQEKNKASSKPLERKTLKSFNHDRKEKLQDRISIQLGTR